MQSTLRESLAKAMADRVGHGMEEKCMIHAEAAVDWLHSHEPMVSTFLSLWDAYAKAESNAECARILRLYLTDGEQFIREYMPWRLAESEGQ